MSISQALSEGVQTALIGLSTVFAVLIILMIVISIMKAVFYKKPKEKPATAVNAAEEELTRAIESLPVIDETPQEDEELIAVITAAIAASLNTSTYNLRIKSLRRVDNNQPAWNKAGIRETINSRF